MVSEDRDGRGFCRLLFFRKSPAEATWPRGYGSPVHNFTFDFVGADRLIFATDYNHSDSKFPHTVEEVMERKDLSDTLKAKIMGENAQKLYNL